MEAKFLPPRNGLAEGESGRSPGCPFSGGETPTESKVGAVEDSEGWWGGRVQELQPRRGHVTDSCLLTSGRNVALGSRTYSPGRFADVPAVPRGAGPREGRA